MPKISLHQESSSETCTMSISYICALAAAIHLLAAGVAGPHSRYEKGKTNGVAMRSHQQRINFVFWRRRLFLFFYFVYFFLNTIYLTLRIYVLVFHIYQYSIDKFIMYGRTQAL